MSGLPSLEDQIAILFPTSVLYGLYLATLPVCLRWLLYDYDDWKPRRHINWSMLAVTLIIFVSTTLDTALIVRRNLLGAAHKVGSNVLWSNTAQAFLAHVQTLIADAVLTYRCWIVYNKSLVAVAFPIFLLLVDLACTIASAYWEQERGQPKIINIVIVLYWVCSITLTLYATSLIAYKITVIAKIGSLPTRRILFAMRIIIESGLLYTTTCVMLFISFFTGTTFAQYFLSALNFQVVGIMSNLILIRVAQPPTRATSQPTTTVQFTNQFSSAFASEATSHSQPKEHYLPGNSRLDMERGQTSHTPVE